MRKLRGALVGFGFIAEQGHVPAYAGQDEFELVAVADGCAARREAALRALPGVHVFEDHRALFSALGAELDFVDVCTPPYAHHAITMDALDAGLHVLCEKPLATTPTDARAMVARAAEKQRVLFPSHNYKHSPVAQAVDRALREGLLGTVHLVTLETFRNTHARGVPEWREHWRRERRFSGGGIAMDHGSHTFYLAFHWLKSYPTAISARMYSRAGDTEDTVAATIDFPTGTAIATLTWTAGIRKVIYTVHGDRGAMRVDDDNVEFAVKRVASPDSPPLAGPRERGGVLWDVKTETLSSNWMDASHTGWFRSLFRQFRHAIERHDYEGKEAEDAVRCVELISAAYASARDDGRIHRLGPASSSPRDD